jgi:hypothetical protein
VAQWDLLRRRRQLRGLQQGWEAGCGVGAVHLRRTRVHDEARVHASQASDPLHYSQNFFAYTADFNKDGFEDIFIIGFPGAESNWYENPGEKKDAGHWKKHLAFKVTDNESAVLMNIVGMMRRSWSA